MQKPNFNEMLKNKCLAEGVLGMLPRGVSGRCGTGGDDGRKNVRYGNFLVSPVRESKMGANFFFVFVH